MAEDKEKLIELLNEELGLTPYESRAYIAVLSYGPLSPQGLNQKSGIPRPRTYDVLNSLVGKGLLMEQPGRPTLYAALDPRVGLEKIMMELERKTQRHLQEKKEIAERLSSYLHKLHEKTRKVAVEQERIWVTRTDSAFIVRYCEAIRKMEKEFVVATPAAKPPENEVLEAVKYALKNNKSVRVVRQITPRWTHDELDQYEELIRLGDQVRHLKYDGVRFAVFDKKEVVVLPRERGIQFAVWIRLPQLAAILHEHFETLWAKGQPALPILRKLKSRET